MQFIQRITILDLEKLSRDLIGFPIKKNAMSFIFRVIHSTVLNT